MIYLLLIIIAIGVLLISEDGKRLLNFLGKSALVLGGILLVFGIMALIVVGLMDYWQAIKTILPIVLFGSFAIYWLYSVYRKYQRGELTKQIIKNKAKNLWLENWNEGIGVKIAMVFIILAFSFIIATIIYGLTIDWR